MTVILLWLPDPRRSPHGDLKGRAAKCRARKRVSGKRYKVVPLRIVVTQILYPTIPWKQVAQRFLKRIIFGLGFR